MEDEKIERLVTNSIKIGVISTLSELGLISENLSEKQAHAKYGEKQVKEWRSKRWIVGYPSGNKSRAKFYYKRSELEIASRMLDMNNIIPDTRLKQILGSH